MGTFSFENLGMDETHAHRTEVLCGPGGVALGLEAPSGAAGATTVAAEPPPGKRQPHEPTEDLGDPDGNEQEARHGHEDAGHDPLDAHPDITERGEREWSGVGEPVGKDGRGLIRSAGAWAAAAGHEAAPRERGLA